jgi:hypothetical protein
MLYPGFPPPTIQQRQRNAWRIFLPWAIENTLQKGSSPSILKTKNLTPFSGPIIRDCFIFIIGQGTVLEPIVQEAVPSRSLLSGTKSVQTNQTKIHPTALELRIRMPLDGVFPENSSNPVS